MSDIIVPSSPADLEAINKVMKDVSDSMTMVQGQQDYQKETFKELEEKYGIKAKHFRRMAKDFHKDEFDRKVDEQEGYQSLYESVFETNFNATDNGDD